MTGVQTCAPSDLLAPLAFICPPEAATIDLMQVREDDELGHGIVCRSVTGDQILDCIVYVFKFSLCCDVSTS